MLDLFGQMMIVDCGKSLGRYITHYRNEFFYPSGFGGFDWQLQKGAEEKIFDRIRPVTTTLLSEDHLDLPEMLNNPILVDLPPKARKFYNDLEEHLIAKLDDGVVAAKHAGIATAKCRQACNGGVYDDVRHVVELHEAKVDVVESLVEELQGSPLLVFYQFKHDLERLLRRFPDAPHLKGGQSAAETRKVIDAWNEGVPLVLAQCDVVYHGLNLQEGPGHTMAWFGLTWDWEVYFQCTKRVWRNGQKAKHVVNHIILARNTIDEDMLEIVVGKKGEDSKHVMRSLRTKLSARALR
jgi:SNF2 family DNA or RNA helicase